MKTKDNAQLRRKKRHNQIKGLLAVSILLSMLMLGHFAIAALALLVFYILNEALWSDHIFYDTHSDYNYTFDTDHKKSNPCRIEQGKLHIINQGTTNKSTFNQEHTKTSNGKNTLLLKLSIKSTLSGSVYDPYITIRSENRQQSQYFERNAKGQRYINISDFSSEIASNDPVSFQFHHCKPASIDGEIVQFFHADFTQKKLLVLAPHADDAELAAFGLYSQSDTNIVTITAGEIEMEDYARFYSSPEEASRLKGRLRTWDSLAIPLWGNTPPNKCTQLGYFCLTLKDMCEAPDKAVTSRTAGINSTAFFRQSNHGPLQSDNNNEATWNNLVQDLQELIAQIKPDAIITPHPELDPHQDHFYTTKALAEALPADSPITLLLYANHYRSTDHFGFGPANSSVGLPPNFDPSLLSPQIVSVPIREDLRIDKALSLSMMHDLQSSPSIKKQIRRSIQQWVCRRDHYHYGNNDFFSKTIKQQELFISCSAKSLKETLSRPQSHQNESALKVQQ